MKSSDLKNGSLIGLVILLISFLTILLVWWFIQVVKNDLVDSEPLVTMADGEVPATTVDSENTLVQVANATNKPGFASQATNYLDNLQYVVGRPIDAEKLRLSSVYYVLEPESKQDEALAIADVFGINSDFVEPFPDDFELADFDENADVLILLGSDARLE